MLPIRVMAVDDHPMVRAGVRSTLLEHPDIVLVAEATDGADAFYQLSRLDPLPHIMLLDLAMPRMDGLQVLAALPERFPTVAVIIITGSAQTGTLAECLIAGARGYVLKDQFLEMLPLAIRVVYHGGCVIPSTLKVPTGPPVVGQPVPMRLTERELTILKFVAQGLSNREIGLQLTLSEATIKKHVQALLAKLDAEGRGHAAIIAMKNGWIE